MKNAVTEPIQALSVQNLNQTRFTILWRSVEMFPMKNTVSLTLIPVLFVAIAASTAFGGGGVVLTYETEITELGLTGTFPLPLGPEFSIVDSTLTLSESPDFDSTGEARAFFAFRPGGGGFPTSPEEILDGDEFFVESFFDVFFDITVEDVDAGNDFHPGFGGTTIQLPHSGDPAEAARMQLGQDKRTTTADTSKPNFGLFPIEGDVYLGHVDVTIPLPFSVGGSPQENDVLKFQFTTHNVGEVSDTFLTLPDGTIVETFDSSAPFEGSIFDESVDPPFGPFTLNGPTTTTSNGPQPPGIRSPQQPSWLPLQYWRRSSLRGVSLDFSSRKRKRESRRYLFRLRGSLDHNSANCWQ